MEALTSPEFLMLKFNIKLLTLLLLAPVYFLPTIIALFRDHPSAGAIRAWNFIGILLPLVLVGLVNGMLIAVLMWFVVFFWAISSKRREIQMTE